MFLHYIPQCCLGNILLSLILWAFAGHAYRVNAKRPADDPDKKDFHPAAVHLVPFTWPFLLILLVFTFVLRAVLYGIFLILFTIALVVFRKPFLFTWLDKIATKIGSRLLEINTLLARALFPNWRPQPT